MDRRSDPFAGCPPARERPFINLVLSRQTHGRAGGGSLADLCPKSRCEVSGNGANTMIIGLEQQSMIDAVLSDIMGRTSALMVALATSDGRPVAIAGRHDGVNAAGICALAAAELAASQELARIIDDQDSCQAILLEGQRCNLMIHDVGKAMVLLVVAPRAQTIGWVRVVVREAVDGLCEVASQIGDRGLGEARRAPPVSRTGIGEALDDIWVEGDVH